MRRSFMFFPPAETGIFKIVVVCHDPEEAQDAVKGLYPVGGRVPFAEIINASEKENQTGMQQSTA